MSSDDGASPGAAAAAAAVGKVLEYGPITWLTLSDVGINPIAVQLVAESYQRSGLLRAFPTSPVAFEVEGVRFELRRVGEPQHAGVRRDLGLPPSRPGGARGREGGRYGAGHGDDIGVPPG